MRILRKRLSKFMLDWCRTAFGPVQQLPWKAAAAPWSDDTVDAIEDHNSRVDAKKRERGYMRWKRREQGESHWLLGKP